ncbi:MAG: T9SS type A sorting domain-containing protein, partial [Bacteroidetes bacterium]|nr:T9SS type A sorting domain-containing protein [Bacteroidota bacterium]
ALNNGSIWLYGNLNISAYRSQIIEPGTGNIRFSSSGFQTITGAPAVAGQAILPRVRVEKPGGSFTLTGAVSFGNGFSYQNADVQFDPDFTFCMAGGTFMVENLFIPRVVVAGTSTLSSNLICMGDLEINSNGLLINSTLPISVNGSFNNQGRYKNMSGLINVTGSMINHGEFSANTGSVNALSGISLENGAFSCNAGQVNVLGVLTLNNGTFSCNDGLVQISGNFVQNGGTLNGNLNAGAMTVSQNFTQNAGTYNAQNGTLNIGGILTMSSEFVRGNGTVNFNGIGPQNIPALYYNKLAIAGTGRLITLAQAEIKIGAATGGFAPNATNAYISTNNTINYSAAGNQEIAGFAYHNLTVSRTGTKSLTGNASVKEVLEVKNSAILDADGAANNKLLTMLSNQYLTARIAPITGSGSITGNVSVQRWTRGGIRSNRFFASPVDTAGGIKIKQFKDDILVYGPGGIAAGFDNPTVFTKNIYVYDEALPNGTEWRSPVNISEVVPRGKGVLVYHLGDRSQNPLQNITVPNPATLDFIGTPNQGSITIPMECTAPCIETDNGNGWNLVANPYASPIDWDSPEWIKSGLGTTIYIWNPRMNQYAMYNSANPGAATNGGSRYIGPGQAFFMKATSNTPVLIANENVKTSTFPDTLLFRLAAPQNQLRLVLYNETESSRDEVVLAFDERSTEGFDAQFDVLKPRLPMMISNLAMRSNSGDQLGVHTFPSPAQGDAEKRIPLILDAIAGSYTLDAEQLESFGTDVQFYLENTLTGDIRLLESGKSIQIDVPDGKEQEVSNAYVLRLNRGYNSGSPAVSGIKVYPNPSKGEAVQVWLGDQSSGQLEIFDSVGRLVTSERVTSAGSALTVNSLQNAQPGVYTLTWTTEYSRSSARITVN